MRLRQPRRGREWYAHLRTLSVRDIALRLLALAGFGIVIELAVYGHVVGDVAVPLVLTFVFSALAARLVGRDAPSEDSDAEAGDSFADGTR